MRVIWKGVCVCVCVCLRMPKRKNPFGDVVPVQAKVHASFKQVATEAERQEVYGEQ